MTENARARTRALSEAKGKFEARSSSRRHRCPQAPHRTLAPPERLRRLAAALHSLGERALYEYLLEVADGADPWARLERYAEMAPLASFIAAHDGDRLPRPRIIDGGRR
jgi:hypothetical protein